MALQQTHLVQRRPAPMSHPHIHAGVEQRRHNHRLAVARRAVQGRATLRVTLQRLPFMQTTVTKVERRDSRQSQRRQDASSQSQTTEQTHGQ